MGVQMIVSVGARRPDGVEVVVRTCPAAVAELPPAPIAAGTIVAVDVARMVAPAAVFAPMTRKSAGLPQLPHS